MSARGFKRDREAIGIGHAKGHVVWNNRLQSRHIDFTFLQIAPHSSVGKYALSEECKLRNFYLYNNAMTIAQMRDSKYVLNRVKLRYFASYFGGP
jgi:hypothetical protein